MIREYPDEIFHYSSAQGLMGIIDTSSLWATDTRFLNDKTELVHGLGICAEELADRRLTGLFGDICHGIATKLDTRGYFFFAASLCEADDLIPQWRGYGANGSGYAIGLDTTQLLRMHKHFSVLRVLYTDEHKRLAAQRMIDSFGVAWTESEGTRQDRRSEVATAIATAMLTGLTLLAASFKPEVFAYEREWRLVQILHRDRVTTGEISFRDSQGLLVPYVMFRLRDPACEVDALPLKSIRTGPALQNEAKEDAVRLFLASRGLSALVTSSNAPLRFESGARVT